VSTFTAEFSLRIFGKTEGPRYEMAQQFARRWLSTDFGRSDRYSSNPSTDHSFLGLCSMRSTLSVLNDEMILRLTQAPDTRFCRQLRASAPA
jgi:hypothetical protein